MHIFWRLILAHLLADFTLQTDAIASWKRRNAWGVLAHSFIFFACAAALCQGVLAEEWMRAGPLAFQGWLVIALLSLAHFLEDEWRAWKIRSLKSQDSFFFFLWDQLIHGALIFSLSPRSGDWVPEKGVALAILFILATHFTSIVVYYIGKDAVGNVQIAAREKYFSMVERLAMIVSLVLPGWWLLLFPVVLFSGMAVRRLWQERSASWVPRAAGCFMAVVFGIFARLIFYT